MRFPSKIRFGSSCAQQIMLAVHPLESEAARVKATSSHRGSGQTSTVQGRKNSPLSNECPMTVIMTPNDNGDRITIADPNLRRIRYGVFQGRVPSIKGAVGSFVGVSILVASLELILKFVHIHKLK